VDSATNPFGPNSRFLLPTTAPPNQFNLLPYRVDLPVTEYDCGLVEFAALARVSCYAMTFTNDSRHVDRTAGRT